MILIYWEFLNGVKVVIIIGGREGEFGKESNKKFEEGKVDRRMDMMVYFLFYFDVC